LTRDQVRLLKADNVVAPGALGFADLKITPQALELVAPTYLRRFGHPRAERAEAS
jgi:NADH dehydrogenase